MSKSEVWDSLPLGGRVFWTFKAGRALLKEKGWAFAWPTDDTLGLSPFSTLLSSAGIRHHTMIMGTTGVGKSSVSSHSSGTHYPKSVTVGQVQAPKMASLQNPWAAMARSSVSGEEKSRSMECYEELRKMRGNAGIADANSGFWWLGHVFASWLLGLLVIVALPTSVTSAWSQDVLSLILKAVGSTTSMPNEWMAFLSAVWPHWIWPTAIGFCLMALVSELKAWVSPFLITMTQCCFSCALGCLRLRLVWIWQKEKIKEWLFENQNAVLKARVKTENDKGAMPTAL